MCATVDDLRYTLSPRQWVEHVERRSLFPWQAAVLDDPSPFIVIDGARQGGKSTVVVKPAAHSAKYYPGSLTVIAAATESQAIEDMMKLKVFMGFDPEYPEIIRSSDSLILLSNDSRIIVVAATEKSARGFSQYDQGPRLIIIDEASRIEEIVYTSAVLPMLTDNPEATLYVISTPHGRKGFFFDSMQDPSASRYHIRAPWDVLDLEQQLVPAEPEEAFAAKCAAKGIHGYYSPRHRRLEEQLRMLRRQGPLMYRQENLGEFVEPLDQVFAYDEIAKMLSHSDVAPLNLAAIPVAETAAMEF
ncbi:MAG TPA: hypothetical protein P5142_00190 [Spirochaetia bacterium]|nr:hypothetical protein [Spirochaetia bacterium]